MRTFKIYFLCNFQICNTVLLTIVILYLHDLLYNWKSVPFDPLYNWKSVPFDPYTHFSQSLV